MSGTPSGSRVNGQFYEHRERPDGTRDLFYGPIGEPDHNHAVIDRFGNPVFIREAGSIIADVRHPYDPPPLSLNY